MIISSWVLATGASIGAFTTGPSVSDIRGGAIGGWIFVCFFISTYTLILIKTRKSRRATRRHQVKRLRFRKNFFVPLILILCFLLFSMLPQQMMVDLGDGHCYYVSLIILQFGSVVRPIVYILMSKHYRKSFLDGIGQMFCCRTSTGVEAALRKMNRNLRQVEG